MSNGEIWTVSKLSLYFIAVRATSRSHGVAAGCAFTTLLLVL